MRPTRVEVDSQESSYLDESGHEAMLEFLSQLQTRNLIKSANVASNYTANAHRVFF